MAINSKRPTILVTNDDGIEAHGLHALATAMLERGDVVVVAPREGHSGMSQALTVRVPVRYREEKANTPYRQYSVNGTPTDCVKLALHTIVPCRPALVVAGINHGSNASINVLYSGTMGATLEGCVAGLPSIGFSLVNREPGADLAPYLPYCVDIAHAVLERGLPEGVALNVNLPRRAVQGVKICRQAPARWHSEYDARKDPWGGDYYWLTGIFESLDGEAEDTDDWALRHSYISIVPTRVDMTDYPMVKAMEDWKWRKH